MNDLIRLTAREAVRRLASRQVSPLEMIDAAEKRIAETDGAVNAIPTLCFDRARRKAKELMAAGHPAEPPRGYLYGLPIAIKDLTEVEGVRSTFGSPIFKDNIPAKSDILVTNLEARGAVVIGKSNTPEFGAGAQTFNEVFGVTKNPWDTRKTCAGSSGGAAVALATGQVWLASGSDLGGSLRTPASFCSIVGLRPSPGRVAHGPVALPYNTMSVEGPMARNVGDAALLLDAMSGQFAEDPISQPQPARSFQDEAERPIVPLRVAWTDLAKYTPVDAEVAAICAKAAQAFTRIGSKVEETCFDLGDPEYMFEVIRAAAFAAARKPLLDKHRDLLKPEVIWNIERGLKLTADDIGQAERQRGALYARAVEFFRTFDIIATPMAVVPPFDHTRRYVEELNGVKFPTYISWVLPAFAFTLCSLPAISIPCGFTKDGLPVGLQLVGPPRGEGKLLAAASLLEAQLGLAGQTPIDPRVK